MCAGQNCSKCVLNAYSEVETNLTFSITGIRSNTSNASSVRLFLSSIKELDSFQIAVLEKILIALKASERFLFDNEQQGEGIVCFITSGFSHLFFSVLLFNGLILDADLYADCFGLVIFTCGSVSFNLN